MILKEILEVTKKTIHESKKNISLSQIKKMITCECNFDFEKSILKKFGIIAEIKKKTPLNNESFILENIKEAKEEYQDNEIVNAISVLTNDCFGMSINDLKELSRKTKKPILRKDFIIDEYQLYESKFFGANAILLMSKILDRKELDKYYEISKDIGLEVIFESSSEDEINKIPFDAKMYGINIRDFNSINLKLDYNNCNLISYLPKNSIKIIESGITLEKIKYIKDIGYDSALIGSSILKSEFGVKKYLDFISKKINSNQCD